MAEEIMEPIESGAVTPAFGTGPYGDKTEVSGPPEITTVTDSYRRFFATDARSVMVTLLPHHYNFIKNPSFRTDTTGWESNAPEAVLPSAVWHVDASQVRADGLALDAIKGSDAVFGTGSNKPVVLPWAGTSYAYIPQNSTTSNYLSLLSATYAATDYIEIDVDLSGTSDTTWVAYTSATTNSAFAVYFTGTSLIYRVYWSAAPQEHTWTSVRLTGRHTYRLVRTTTTVELFVDDVSKGVKTFAQAVGSSAQIVRIGFSGTASSAERSKYYGFRIGDVAIMSPASFTSDYTKVANIGTAGGDWTVNRAATGLKVVLVDRPLLLFSGTQWADSPPITASASTALIAYREWGSQEATYLETSTNPAGGPGRLACYRSAAALTQFRVVWQDGASANKIVSASTAITDGQSIGGWRFTGSSIAAIYRGGITAPTTGTASASGREVMRIGANVTQAGGMTVEFIAAAVFDRALTNAEIAQASTDLLAWRSTQTLLNSDAWVGNSITVNGDAVVRYRDSGYYVYVGIPETIPDRFFATDLEPDSRMSAEWSFSAYFKGTGRVRLVMDAYLPTQAEVAYSPPINQNLAMVADPGTANYGDAAVLDSNGMVWERGDPPFYFLLGTPPTSAASPSMITTKGLMAPAVVDGRNSIWEAKTTWPATAPYYTEWGVPLVKAAPLEEPAGAKYIQDGTGIIYQLISPAPGAAPYYRTITPPYSDKPEYLIPDKSKFEPFYIYNTNELWQIKNPIPSAAPYYELKGTFAAAPGDPETIPPGSTYVSYLRTVTPPPPQPAIQMTEIWQVVPKPYYFNTGGAAYLARVEGDWIDILERDWQRLVISTTARWPGGTSFFECSWIDARVEVQDATNLRISSFLLDPNEAVVAEYFDGSMSEDAEIDDYLWEDDTKANNSISWYYYDRRTRARWLYENLPRLVPANRPVQIFFNDYKHPYTPGSSAGVQSQSQQLRPRIGL